MATSSTVSSAAPRAFQFRLGTLLIATMWAALVSLGLRTPTPLWSGVIAVLTLLSVLFAVLLIIYRSGRTRAMAIGFLVFCVGYLTYLAVLAGTLSAGLSADTTPVGGAFGWMFRGIHPPVAMQGGFGSGEGGGGGFGSGGFESSGYGGGYGGGGMGTTMVQRYDSDNFVAISNHALACLLGVVGSVAAQVLFASQASEGAPKKDEGRQ